MLLNWFSIIFFNNRQIWTSYRIAIVKGDQKTTGVNISGTVCLIYLKLLQIWTWHLEYNNIEVWKLILLCSCHCTAKSRKTALHCRISFQYRSDNKLFETLSTGPTINILLILILIVSIYMGQILQDGKKVLEMSSTYLHSKSRPAQTVGPGTFSF